MDYEVAVVMGKGRRPRSCPFGAKTGQALDRYLRVRDRHKHAKLPEVWLGDRGPLSTSGIRQMLTRRGRDAGVKVHLHMFRHTFAHLWKAAGGSDDDLMRLAGWRFAADAATLRGVSRGRARPGRPPTPESRRSAVTEAAARTAAYRVTR